MNNDKKLEELAEAYFLQRVHAPRLDISDKLRLVMTDEIKKLLQSGIKPKRILAAIDFIANSITASVKKDIEYVKDIQKPKEKQIVKDDKKIDYDDKDYKVGEVRFNKL